MSFSGSLTSIISYMTKNSATEVFGSGLFDIAMMQQPVFHTVTRMSPIGGKSIVIGQISLVGDGDPTHPVAAVSISNADVASTRSGIQICPSSSPGYRSATSGSSIIPTKNQIELNPFIQDSGDLVLTQRAIFSIIPIKEA